MNRFGTCEVLFYLSKAFHSFDVTLLLNKLECYGVRKNIKLIIKLYLAEGKQFVKFCEYVSLYEKN